MEKNTNYLLKISSKLLLFILLFPSIIFAQNETKQNFGQTFGHGLISCKEYRKSATAPAKKIAWHTSDHSKAWADGYLTAVDTAIFTRTEQQVYVPSMYTISPDLPESENEWVLDSLQMFSIREAMWNKLDNYCKKNPESHVNKAVEHYVNDWYPKHLIEKPEGKKPILQLPHLGTGKYTCQEYNLSIQNPGKYTDEEVFLVIDLDKAAESWVQGYVSATSFGLGSAGQNPPSLEATDSLKKMKPYCKANPSKRIIDFASEYIDNNLINVTHKQNN